MGKKNIKEALADETNIIVDSVIESSVDCIIGGFPCQDISIGNNNASGLAGEHSGLFWQLVNTLRMVRPKYALLENVAALFQRQRRKDMGGILAALADIGYNIEWDCISSSSIGAPHHRARAFFLAHFDGDRLKRHFPQKMEREQAFSWCASFRNIEDVSQLSDLYPSQLCRGAHGTSKRLHGIGNGNPPQIIKQVMSNLK